MSIFPTEREFWPSSMTRDCCWATDEQIAQAFYRWVSFGSQPRTTSGLAVCLANAGAKDKAPGKKWRFQRLADAVAQRARKAGFIYSHKSQWHVVEGKE